METIINFFKSIGDIIATLGELLIDFVKGTVEFFSKIPDYVEIAYSYIDILPEEIKIIAMMTLSLSVLFLVIGKKA